jgi:hypothetical protein
MAVYRGRLRHFQIRLAGDALADLAGIVGHFIPPLLLARLRTCGQRERLFSPLATFWNFLGTALPGDGAPNTGGTAAAA